MEPSISSSEIQLEDPSTAALIRSMADGDASAMSYLYDATNRSLFGLVMRILPDLAAAEEALLDIYTHLWRHAEEFDAGKGSAMAWLISVARAQAIERLRVMKKYSDREDAAQPLAGEADTSGALAELSMNAEWRNRIRFAVEALPPEQRQVIDLAYYGGLSCSEIAVGLGQSPTVVSTHARLGMLKLSDLLRALIDGLS